MFRVPLFTPPTTHIPGGSGPVRGVDWDTVPARRGGWCCIFVTPWGPDVTYLSHIAQHTYHGVADAESRSAGEEAAKLVVEALGQLGLDSAIEGLAGLAHQHLDGDRRPVELLNGEAARPLALVDVAAVGFNDE